MLSVESGVSRECGVKAVVVILVFVAIVAVLLLTEWSFRRFVSPKIRDIFENRMVPMTLDGLARGIKGLR